MLKRVALALLSVVTAAACFAVAAALALLAVEKVAVDMSRVVARATGASGVSPETVMLGGLGAVAMAASAVLMRWDTRLQRGSRYRNRRYSRPARRGRWR